VNKNTCRDFCYSQEITISITACGDDLSPIAAVSYGRSTMRVMRGKMINRPTEKALYYEIRLKGHLERRWVKWFNGMKITLSENGTTILSGSLADQAALHGILRRVRDVGLPLLSVNSIEPDPEEVPET